jgi:hypothetical protein
MVQVPPLLRNPFPQMKVTWGAHPTDNEGVKTTGIGCRQPAEPQAKSGGSRDFAPAARPYLW